MERQAAGAHRTSTRPLVALATAAAYYAVAHLSLGARTLVPSVSPLWPSAGIGLAAALTFGRVPASFGIFAASIAIAWTRRLPPLAGLVMCLANVFEVYAADFLLEKAKIDGHSFYQPRDFAVFSLIAAASCAASSSAAVATFAATGVLGGVSSAFTFATRLLGHWTGMLTVAPLLRLWAMHPRFSWRPAYTLEGTGIIAATAGVCWMLFSGRTDESVAHIPLSFLLLPVALWPAVRQGLRETATVIMIVSATALWGTVRDMGPFGALPHESAISVLQGFIAVETIVVMSLASAVWRAKDTSAELESARGRLRLVNAELERRVAQRTARLQQVNAELESFAYSVAHDLRSPLRKMSGFSEAVLRDYAGRLDPKGSGYLHRIFDASRRMGRLIDEMLDLSMVTRSEIHDELVDLSRAARQRLEELRRLEPGREVAAAVADGLSARGDRGLLETALRNLIDNAWKFTGPKRKARIEVGMIPQEPAPIFFVRDDGVGFDMAESGRLFNAFERLHSREKFPGSGIGLATVQRVVQRHGGRVWAQGERGKGATFYFTLHERPSG